MSPNTRAKLDVIIENIEREIAARKTGSYILLIDLNQGGITNARTMFNPLGQIPCIFTHLMNG